MACAARMALFNAFVPNEPAELRLVNSASTVSPAISPVAVSRACNRHSAKCPRTVNDDAAREPGPLVVLVLIGRHDCPQAATSKLCDRRRISDFSRLNRRTAAGDAVKVTAPGRPFDNKVDDDPHSRGDGDADKGEQKDRRAR
jgi:hypothetical protein